MLDRLRPLSATLLLTAALAPAWTEARAATMLPAPAATTPTEAEEFVRYWHEGGMALWFGKDPVLDRRLRDRYLPLHERAARGELEAWAATPTGALALVLLLDQFPRNAFRDTRRMYATDELARHVAHRAAGHGLHREVPFELRKFFLLPFAHSESLADQQRAVELARELTPYDLERAEHHHAIVQRFGRFPHRNAILGRPSTAEEHRYLAEGGYRG